MNDLKKISPEELKENPFTLIGTDWMLITAGNKKSFNTMTASWGGLGVLWNRYVCFCFVRPTRHTYGFMEKNDKFTLSFLEKGHRKILEYCGANSGRDVDKVKNTGLLPEETPAGSVYYKQARLVLECRKIYYQDITPGHFLDPVLSSNYENEDYHRMYAGEIVGCYIKK